MKAVVFKGIGNIAFEDVEEPRILDPRDAIVRITTSAIWRTDLHLVKGTMPGVKPGTILGHEGIGIIEEVGESQEAVAAKIAWSAVKQEYVQGDTGWVKKA